MTAATRNLEVVTVNWELEKRVVVGHLQSSLTRIVVPQYQARNSNERAAWSIANTVSDNVKSQDLRYDSGCRAMGMPVLVVGGVVTKERRQWRASLYQKN